MLHASNNKPTGRSSHGSWKEIINLQNGQVMVLGKILTNFLTMLCTVHLRIFQVDFDYR